VGRRRRKQGLANWIQVRHRASRQDSLKGLLDYVTRAKGYAEEPAGEVGDRLPSLVSSATAGHGGAGPDADKIGVARALPEATHEEANVGSLPTAIGVKLIEHEELQAGAGLVHEGTLVGPHEHQLEHDVVGEQDVRWAPP